VLFWMTIQSRPAATINTTHVITCFTVEFTQCSYWIKPGSLLEIPKI
jgi:hypothetical protein